MSAPGRMNLSAWALQHRALTLFAMLAVAAAGIWAYLSLGRAEDPPFTIKQMVIMTDWPGASADEMMREVTDRIERKLEELPYLDYTQSYSEPGHAAITVSLKDSTPPRMVPDLWYQVRKKIGDIQQTLPAGRSGPVLQRRVRRRVRHRLRRHRRWLHSAAAQARRGGHSRAAPLGAWRRQDRPDRHAGRAYLSRFLLPQAGPVRADGAGCIRRRTAPEQRGRGRFRRYAARSHLRSHVGRAGCAGGARIRAGSGAWPPRAAARSRHHPARHCGATGLHHADQRQAGARARDLHGRGREHPRPRPCTDCAGCADGADLAPRRADDARERSIRSRGQGCQRLPGIVPRSPRDRAVGEFPQPRLAYRDRGRNQRSGGSGRRAPGHEAARHRFAAHLPGRDDHRARPAGG